MRRGIMAISGSMVQQRCLELKRDWNERNKKFRDWYEQLEMVDTLAQKDMESFVGNDPRTAFNHLIGILDQKIPHRIDPEELSLEQVAPAAELSRSYDRIWRRTEKQYRQRGRLFKRDLISFLLSTGWYSVFTIPNMDGSSLLTEVWNPATVFQAWDDVLFECAHIFTASATQAKRLATRNQWNIGNFHDKMTIYDRWWLDDGGKVYNATSVDTTLVKDETPELRFPRIPIFTSPVNGLPDTGEINIRKSTKWRGELGQGYIVANENVYGYFNKWWTFLMQILRDYAQARTYEKTNSARQIVQPESWYKRGAHYKLGQQDDVGFIVPPPIPMEIRSTQLDLEAMMQRGGPTWQQYGNVSAGMTAYVMSQVVASTNNTASAFHQGIIDCVGDIDEFWKYLMQEHNYKPYGQSIPEGLPEDFEILTDYELRIPGDLTQRATNARMLNPDFSVSEERVMEWNFPEIKNPAEEMAKRDAGMARHDPIFAQLSLISALRQEAELLRRAKDADGAKLYDKAADMKEQEIMGLQQGQAQQGRAAPRPGPATVPPPGMAPPMATAGGER